MSKKQRPAVLDGITLKLNVGCGRAYIILNRDERGKINEILTQLGKSGQCARVQTSVICRQISNQLKTTDDPDATARMIMGDLLGETCDRWSGGPRHARSCADAIARAVGLYLGDFVWDGEDLVPAKDKK